MAQPTHFTCTLGQAAILNRGRKPISNINEFIDCQAEKNPLLPALAIPRPNTRTGPWTNHVYTFRDIFRGSCYAADVLTTECPLLGADRQTVALLSPSTAEFVFVWLALIKLGHSVLLLAPQCQPAAIAHLCKTCNARVLYHDQMYEKQAQETERILCDTDVSLTCVSSQLDTDDEAFHLALSRPCLGRNNKSGDMSDQNAIAYLHHTSGTSTGLPKPIPQSHRAAIGVLPQTLDGRGEAMFTTTPMYHGGPADMFRAWTSNAMICLFPGKGVPITAHNVVACLDAVICDAKHNLPPIVYFACVPYLLQMMASDASGLKKLQEMHLVGVGGAALPAEVGDELVKNGVNLVSRFGSAECGFLLASHRDYKQDKAWQYLRAGTGAEALAFEQRGNGVEELVVMKDWPHRAKTNRSDGSYATSDLFIAHPSIPNAWKYHSRADSQITLITGKKFDPAPLESSIATSEFLEDVLIFGNGQPFPGAILFRSEQAAGLSDEELISCLAATIERLNTESQDHARIGRNMLVAIPFGENKLEKSSKGTIMRSKAEETYDKQIKQAYAGLKKGLGRVVPDNELLEVLIQHIQSIIARSDPLEPATDLFSYGVDSVASIQIRYMVEGLLPDSVGDLPLSVVEDCGTPIGLADFVKRSRRGEMIELEDELILMRELVNHYGNIETSPTAVSHSYTRSTASPQEGEVILLTGATGALGAHLLHLYRSSPSVSHIYLLVRGSNSHAAYERVEKSLTQRGLPGIRDCSSTGTPSPTVSITVLQSQLSSSTLGLDASTYALLSASLTQITHAAWSVNFRQRLRAFAKDHIAGTRHLLDLARTGQRRPRFAFISSLASVANYRQPGHGTPGQAHRPRVPETLSHDPSAAGPLGYARSKWVAEGLLAQAVETAPGLLRGRVSVYRVGQLSGDMEAGIWNASEAWPLLLKSCCVTGVLPDLGSGEALSWLAVDVAARGVVEGTLRPTSAMPGSGVDGTGDGAAEVVQIYHVLNDATAVTTWKDLLVWMGRLEPAVRIVSPAEWLRKMEELQKTRPEYPALKLLGLWQSAYGNRDKGEEEAGVNGGVKNRLDEEDGQTAGEDVQYDTTNARSVAPALKSVVAVDEAYFEKLWLWVKANV